MLLILKNCLVTYETRFKWKILCFEYLICINKDFDFFLTFSFYPFKPSFVKATTFLVAVDAIFGIH